MKRKITKQINATRVLKGLLCGFRVLPIVTGILGPIITVLLWSSQIYKYIWILVIIHAFSICASGYVWLMDTYFIPRMEAKYNVKIGDDDAILGTVYTKFVLLNLAYCILSLVLLGM